MSSWRLPRLRRAIRRTAVAVTAGKVDAAVEGEPLEIAFNVKFLLDVLPVVGQALALEMTAPNTPALVRPAEGNGFIQVLMPMTLQGNNR
jgi:DNA polymerase III sliding clamp (beta) subunit (PCNA family)